MAAGPVGAAVFAALMAFLPLPAGAQQGPQGAIELTVGSGAGGTPDLMMRRLAGVLEATGLVSQPIVVTDRPGDNWIVAMDYVLSQRGNQNLMVAIVPTLLTTPIVQKLPRTYAELTPVAMLMRMNLVLVERPDGPDADLAALVRRAGQQKGADTVTFGGANLGTTDHIVAELIDRAADIAFNYVPFDGGGTRLMAAFFNGDVDVILLTLGEAHPLIVDGRARPLAVLSEERVDLDLYKTVPTAREQGVEVVWDSWYGIAGAPGLTPDVVAWWDDRLSRVVETDAWRAEMAEHFLVTDYRPSGAMRPALDRLHDHYAAVLDQLELVNR